MPSPRRTSAQRAEVQPLHNRRDVTKIKTLQPIIDAKLPGFYLDVTGALCIMIGPYRISCYVDQDDDTYTISTDMLDNKGDFALCVHTETARCHKTAIQQLRWAVKETYAKTFKLGERT